MALLIYKQWHKNNNLRGSAESNAMHLKYIGERVHVLKDENSSNGLFGKFDNSFSSDVDMTKIMSYVRSLSKKNITMFRSVISFTPERAEMLGLGKDLSSWQRFVKYHIADIAKGNNIGLNSIEYMAAVHLKDGQPHVHITFWNTEQQVGINYVNPEACDNIRENIETSAFAEAAEETMFDEELPDGYIPDNGNKVRQNLIRQAFSEERKSYHEIQQHAFGEISGVGRDNLTALLKSAENEAVKKLFEEILKIIPPKGRLAYDYMPPDVKGKIDEMSTLLAKLNPLLRQYINSYTEAKRLEAEMFNSTVTPEGIKATLSAVNKSRYQVRLKMGNAVLQAVKGYKREMWLAKQAEYSKRNQEIEASRAEREREAQKYQIEAACISALRLLNSLSAEANTSLQKTSAAVLGKGDLSKAAIRDIIYKEKDKDGQEL